MKRLAAAALALVTLAAATGAQADKKSTALFVGGDIGPNAETVWAGAVIALNGDFGRDGFLLRGLGVYSAYDYLSAGGTIDGDLAFFDAMIGYQILRPALRVAAYVGLEYQDHELSPFDPTNRVVGSETGVKVAGDVTLGHGQQLFANISAAYSDVFDTWFTRLRIGYNYQNFTFGPEGQIGGNISYQAERLGGFVTMRVPDTSVEITLSAGKEFNDDGGLFAGEDGGYGQINLGYSF